MNKKIIYSVFDSVADRHAKDTAIIDHESAINYEDLKTYSDDVACSLLEARINKKDNVAIFSYANISYIAAIIGTNKAGGVFVPIEPTLPIKRMEYMLNLTTPKFLITSDQLLDSLIEIINTLSLSFVQKILTLSYVQGKPEIAVYDREGNQLNSHLDKELISGELKSEADDPSYLLFTSGTTGYPKAILGATKSLSHFVHWEIKEFGITNEIRGAILAPLSFDVSLRDIFVPLIAGGTLCIPTPEVKQSPARLIEWCGSNSISLLHMVPSVFRAVTHTLSEDTDLMISLKSLKHILLAGEALYGRDVLNWRQVAGDHVELVNLYGPSETTLAKVFNRITDVTNKDAIIALGKPIDNAAVLILDGKELCGVGKVGEICIKTPFRSLGYYKDPEGMNDTKFIQNPLHNDFPDLIYKSGDMGRYIEGWTIEFIGRKDSQVKIRGNRVDLIEIENLALKTPGVDQAVITDIMGKDNQLFICCYYTTSLEEEAAKNNLILSLTESLPDYMHPSFYARIDKFPLNINGKIDRRSLPMPEEMLYQENTYEAPATELEEKLSKIWSEVIDVSKIGITNSFFELGGHSLSATILISKIYKTLGIEVTLKEFFDNPTIKSLAKLIEGQKKITYKNITPVLTRPYYEVSHAQKRVFIDHIKNARVYNMQDSYLITGNFDFNSFEQALDTLVKRHDILRTTFVTIEGEPKQKVHEAENYAVQIDYEDIRQKKDRISYAKKVAADFSNFSFDLKTVPLIKPSVMRLEDDTYVFLLTMHHIISDGWSKDIMVDEIITLYNAYSAGKENPLKPLKIQYKDFTVWQNRQLLEASFNPHKAFWTTLLKEPGAPASIPQDFEKSGNQSGQTGHFTFDLSKELSEGLTGLASAHHTSLFIVLQSIVKLLVYRYSGAKDIVFGTPVAGREHPDLNAQIGLYVNTLALRSIIEPQAGFTQLLASVKELTLSAHEHQIYPYDSVVNSLIERGHSGLPIYAVMMQLITSVSTEKKEMAGVEIRRFTKAETRSQIDLYFNFILNNDLIMVDIEYNADIFKEETIDFVKYNLINICELCAAEPEKKLSEIVELNLNSVHNLQKEINVAAINF